VENVQVGNIYLGRNPYDYQLLWKWLVKTKQSIVTVG